MFLVPVLVLALVLEGRRRRRREGGVATELGWLEAGGKRSGNKGMVMMIVMTMVICMM